MNNGNLHRQSERQPHIRRLTLAESLRAWLLSLRCFFGLRFGNAFVLGLAMICGACSMPSAEADEGIEGTLTIPLTQPAPGGGTYHLRNAMFRITGDGVDTVASGDVDVNAISLPLLPGRYEVELLDGWSIEFVDPSSTPQPVEVVLASRNPQTAHVHSELPAWLVFQFLLGTTEGPLTITFGVNESWVLAGSLYVYTNEPQPSSTGAFQSVLPGSEIATTLHIPANVTVTSDLSSGVLSRTIYTGPHSVQFFGNQYFHDILGPAFTGFGSAIEVTNSGSLPYLDLAPSYFFGQESANVWYQLDLAGGPALAAGSVDADGIPSPDWLQIFPTFTLQRFEAGYSTDKLTGSIYLQLNAQ